MHAPLYSTITLIAEIFVSAIIYYTLYSGFKHGKFPSKLAFFALFYEAAFNITYMTSRVPSHVKVAKIESPATIALAATHGILSLIMFIALIIFFFVAFKNYKKGMNYFREHKKLTFIFLFFWSFSILSGVLFYFVEYVI